MSTPATVEDVLGILNDIIPPEEEANELTCQPSWLTLPDGSRAVIDIWYPGVPLAVSVRTRAPWGSRARRRALEINTFIDQVLWEGKFVDEEHPQPCPHLIITGDRELSYTTLINQLRDLHRVHPNFERLAEYAYRNSAR